MKYIIIYITFTFMVIVTGCGNNSAINQAKVQTELDSIDYEIISAAFEWLLKPNKPPIDDGGFDPNNQSLMISDSTDIFLITHKRRFSDERKFDSIENLIADKIFIENKNSFYIDHKKINKYKTYPLLKNSNFEQLYRKYPDVWGIIGFSKPAYSLNDKKAGVYIYFEKDSKHARGAYVWLLKQNNIWEIYDSVGLWES